MDVERAFGQGICYLVHRIKVVNWLYWKAVTLELAGFKKTEVHTLCYLKHFHYHPLAHLVHVRTVLENKVRDYKNVKDGCPFFGVTESYQKKIACVRNDFFEAHAAARFFHHIDFVQEGFLHELAVQLAPDLLVIAPSH